MREFKFRMWLPKKDYPTLKEINKYGPHPSFKTRMSDVTFLCEEGYPMKFEENGDGHIYFKEAIVMQYTGLKDANDKEVYEGDILQCTINKEDIYEVDWDCGCFWASGNTIRDYLYHENKTSFIIGNIYENPELKP